MKQSTTFAICSIISAIWCMATVYAVAFNHFMLIYPIEYLIIITPFISFIMCIILHNIELREELNSKNN